MSIDYFKLNYVEAFPMDDLGNRTGSVTQRDGAHTYAVNSLTNRYTSIDAAVITHDAAGNITQDKDGYHYVYDYENRVTRIYKLDGQTEITVAVFAYDALGRRIKKTDSIASETTYYYYNDQWQILAEYAGSAFGNSYVYGNYIDEVLVMNDGTNDYYYAHDHLFSPVALIETDGDVVQRYEYDAYGKMTRLNPNFTAFSGTEAGNPYYFTGRQLDILDSGSLKHMHYRHRDYSPFMGRFMQQDPLGAFPTLSLNFVIPLLQYYDGVDLYRYAKDNPLFWIDPFGYNSYYPIPGYDPAAGSRSCKKQPDYNNCMDFAKDARDRCIQAGTDVYNAAVKNAKEFCYSGCEYLKYLPLIVVCRTGCDTTVGLATRTVLLPAYLSWAAGCETGYGKSVYGCQISHTYMSNCGPQNSGDECAGN